MQQAKTKPTRLYLNSLLFMQPIEAQCDGIGGGNGGLRVRHPLDQKE